MAGERHFRDKYYGGPGCVRARCQKCGAQYHVNLELLDVTRVDQWDEPCDSCNAVAWREETDDEYAEFMLGPFEGSEPISTRLASEVHAEDEWSDVRADLVECLES